jgi:hypothetical protein
LRLDPVNCRSISIRSLTAIAELRQRLDGRFVRIEVEA